jgi:hypothetical protein
MHKLHGFFGIKDQTLLPIDLQPCSVVPLQVVAPTSIKSWSYLSVVDKISIKRENGQNLIVGVTELATQSNSDIKEMLLIASQEQNPSADQHKILSILKQLVEDEI